MRSDLLFRKTLRDEDMGHHKPHETLQRQVTSPVPGMEQQNATSVALKMASGSW